MKRSRHASVFGQRLQRSLRFLVAPTAVALVLWMASFVLATVLGYPIGRDARAAGFAFVSALVIGLLAAIALRVGKRLRLRPLQQTGSVLLGCGVLGTAWAWLTLRAIGPSTTSLIGRAILATGLTVVVAQTPVWAARWRRRRQQARTARRHHAFELLPKASVGGVTQSPSEVRAQLAQARDAYRSSRREGDDYVAFLGHRLSRIADPRFEQPTPAPLAVRLLLEELAHLVRVESWVLDIEADIDAFPRDREIEPALLHAAGVFAAAYAVDRRSSSRGQLSIRPVTAPEPAIELVTDAAGPDLWFALPENSLSARAKRDLVAQLNRQDRGHERFEPTTAHDSRVSFRLDYRPTIGPTPWAEITDALGKGIELLSTCERSGDANRVLTDGERVYKVRRRGVPSPKPNTLVEEYEILRRLDGVDGTPQSPRYSAHDTYSVLSYDRLEGTTIDRFLGEESRRSAHWLTSLVDLSDLLARLHERAVVHRDLQPDNVLVDARGRTSLIDFDQATVSHEPVDHALDLGIDSPSELPLLMPLHHLIDRLGLVDEYRRTVAGLREVWDIAAHSPASAPGRTIAYYRWAFGYDVLPGERNWSTRWHLLRPVLLPRLAGKQVLDVGCNLGLLSLHCKLYGASHVRAIDVDPEIVRAASMLAEVTGVEIDADTADLNDPATVDRLLEEPPDLLIMLSVLHWLHDKEPALRLLRNVPEVLFEGHGSIAETESLLGDLGFDVVRQIGYTERLRGLFLATRDTAP